MKLIVSANNFGVTELELTGLLVNIHSFMQLLCNRYFEVLVDHKAIEYMSKTESPTTRLKTFLLKLSEYTKELKYQKGSKLHTSDALSRIHNFTDTPDQKDVIPLNFLQHFTPNYIEHSYSHLVENLYAHKTKTLDTMTVKRKCGRPPKPKPQFLTSKTRTTTAAKNLTTQPQQHPRSLNNEIVSRQMINTDIDEHIDLINTLGDMVDQKEEAKKEKFIETMPTMIQTHLIICKDWADVKDKAKSLEHIIRKCDPPTPTMPLMATDATVPGVHSYIVHSMDKEEGKIPQPFKGAKPKQTRGRGKPKGKPQEQRQNPPKAQEADETYTYDSPNNYYHNDKYTAPGQSRGHRPFTGQGGN